ncbi:hypothetical protein FQN57_002103 [Myotisia sp. PD_48]|nr:hypothetical protein FQN57_002103 [Myotisia sp. PD_48]
MDSPTIPGYLPFTERSNSVPGETSCSTTSEGRASPCPSNSSSENRQGPLPAQISSPTPPARFSPTQLPGGFPSPNIGEQNRGRQIGRRSPTWRDEDDVPPKVPPKKLPVAVRKGPRRNPAYSSGSSSTASLRPMVATPGIEFEIPQRRSMTPMKLENRSPPKLTIQPLGSPKAIQDIIAPQPLKTSQPESQKGTNSPSNGNTRTSPSKQGSRIKTRLSPSSRGVSEVPIVHIPPGCSVENASTVLTGGEIELLQSQARRKGEQYEVLKHSEVISLSQELRTLDKHCEYLRETHTSLRSGRQRLHTRVISYLKSASSTPNFSREGLLKQEEALLELDQSIDKWAVKLEFAEGRRARVQQKLLEHMVAALVIPPPQPPRVPEETTPQYSSDESDYSSADSHREDVESIIIYADVELHDLFENIEKEMEMMIRADSDKLPPTHGLFI